MKDAIRGSNNYHATMKQIARNTFQRMNGYIPNKVNTTTALLPICEDCNKKIEETVEKILNWESPKDFNPRSLYLFLAWVIVGSDNPYQLYQYIAEIDGETKHLQAATLHLRIALGQEITKDDFNTFDASGYAILYMYTLLQHPLKVISTSETFTDTTAELAIEMINADYTLLAGTEIIDDLLPIQSCFTQRLQDWIFISDEEVLQIVRQLFFDILDLAL